MRRISVDKGSKGQNMKCPRCGSSQIGGLMQAFFVPLDTEGDMEGSWGDYSSETEIGIERICYDCEKEFQDGDKAADVQKSKIDE